MRDLIELLNESRGLGARQRGEEFIGTTNPDDKIYINSVIFYPIGGTGYPDYNSMVADLEKVAKAIPNASVDLIGKFKPSDRAFGVAVFDRPDNSRLAFIKPYGSIKYDPTQNNWDNQTGIPGYKYNSKSAAKTQAMMTPQDILLTQQSDLVPADIVSQIAEKFGANSPLTQVAQAVANGQSLPISIPAPADMSFTAFRDYFCELLHPIALQTGQYTGNAAEAAEKFLGDATYADCSINFGKDKTEGLSDSIMIAPSGQKIKVSSKGANGAAASAKNLVDAAKELKDNNPKLLKKHSEVIELLQDMVKHGQAGTPLVLGVKYGIIGPADSTDIMNFKNMPPTTIEAALSMKLTPKLKALIKGRGTDNPNNLNLYFHCIAAVAHKVAEHVNENTGFSKAASEILNNGALVQVYTDASETGGKWTLKSFNTIWPSKTVTGVLFSAGKTYYSTGIKGNFTFKILRNGAKPAKDEQEDIDTMAGTAKLKDRVNIRPPGARTTQTKGIGREER